MAKQTCSLGHDHFFALFFRAFNGEIPLEIANLVREVQQHRKDCEAKRKELDQISERLGSVREINEVRRWYRCPKGMFGYWPEDAIAKAKTVKNPDKDVLGYFKTVVKWNKEEQRRRCRLIDRLGMKVFSAIWSGDLQVLRQMAAMMEPEMERGDRLRTAILMCLQRGPWDGPFKPNPNLTLAELKSFLEKFLERPVDRTQIRRIVENEYGCKLARARRGRKRGETVK